MKICPNCQTSYTDDTLSFCLQDGTPLIGSQNPGSDMPTVSFEESETMVKNRQPEQRIRVPVEDSPNRDWKESEVTRIASHQSAPAKKSNILLTVLLTAFVMLLLFGAAGLGAWIYFSDGENKIAKNGNDNSDNSNSNRTRSGESNTNTNSLPNKAVSSPTKTVEKNDTPTPTDTPTPDKPTPDTNPEQDKKDVASRVYVWKSLLENRNLNAYMSNYADRLDRYYNRSGVSKSFVRSDKQRAFNAFDSFSVNISNMQVTVSGDSATAVFDKQWVFSGQKTNSGKVRSQLQFKRVGGDWLITGERDLKVYYVNK